MRAEVDEDGRPICKVKSYKLTDDKAPEQRRKGGDPPDTVGTKPRRIQLGGRAGQISRSADLQMLVEASPETLNALDDRAGAPRKASPHLVSEDEKTWEGGSKAGCSRCAVVTSRVATPNHWLSVAAVHVNNEFAKKALPTVRQVLTELKDYMSEKQVDVIYRSSR